MALALSVISTGPPAAWGEGPGHWEVRRQAEWLPGGVFPLADGRLRRVRPGVYTVGRNVWVPDYPELGQLAGMNRTLGSLVPGAPPASCAPPLPAPPPNPFSNEPLRTALPLSNANHRKQMLQIAKSCSTKPLHSTSQISKPPHGRYWISKGDDGRLHIVSRIRLYFPSNINATRRSEILAKAQVTSSLVRGIFARYGIVYNLVIDSNSDPTPHQLPTSNFTVYDSFPKTEKGSITRAHMGDLFTQLPPVRGRNGQLTSSNGADNISIHFTRTLLHEFGHTIGLRDEYRSLSKSIWRSNPVSIMNSARGAMERTDFYPDHLRNILGPLCGYPKSKPKPQKPQTQVRTARR